MQIHQNIILTQDAYNQLLKANTSLQEEYNSLGTVFTEHMS